MRNCYGVIFNCNFGQSGSILENGWSDMCHTLYSRKSLNEILMLFVLGGLYELVSVKSVEKVW